MRGFLSFPTRTRFGWLGLLGLAVLLAAIQDAAFQSGNWLFGKLSGILGIIISVALIIEAIDHLTGSTTDNEPRADRLTRNATRKSKKYIWITRVRVAMQWGLAILAVSWVLAVLFIAV